MQTKVVASNDLVKKLHTTLYVRDISSAGHIGITFQAICNISNDAERTNAFNEFNLLIYNMIAGGHQMFTREAMQHLRHNITFGGLAWAGMKDRGISITQGSYSDFDINTTINNRDEQIRVTFTSPNYRNANEQISPIAKVLIGQRLLQDNLWLNLAAMGVRSIKINDDYDYHDGTRYYGYEDLHGNDTRDSIVKGIDISSPYYFQANISSLLKISDIDIYRKLVDPYKEEMARKDSRFLIDKGIDPVVLDRLFRTVTYGGPAGAIDHALDQIKRWAADLALSSELMTKGK